MLAVNVDAVVCKNQGVCSTGVVIREQEGKVLVSKEFLWKNRSYRRIFGNERGNYICLLKRGSV